MTPEMWLELVPTLHQCPVQLAAVRQNPSGDARCCLATAFVAFSRSTLVDGCRLPSCGLVPRLGGLGHQNFCPGQFCLEGRCITASGAQGPTLESVAPHPAGGWWLATGSGPVCTVPRCRVVGAACQCWLGTWPNDPCLGDSTLVMARALSS